MGIGKVLPTLVIFSISVMMILSILPAYADEHEGICPRQFSEILVIDAVKSLDPNAGDKDRNDNDWVCWMMTPSGKFIIIDDRVPK